MSTRVHKPTPPAPDDPAQYQRLLDMAKELGVDGSQSTDEVFDRLKPAIINPSPKPVPKKRRPKDRP